MAGLFYSIFFLCCLTTISAQTTTNPPESEEKLFPECKEPLAAGNCSEHLPRFYFVRGECKEFEYTGCYGNSNNFGMREHCSAICRGDRTSCNLSKEVGRCKGAFKRFYYDGSKCAEFTYGGCDGNANNFETEDHCKKACGLISP